MERELGASSVTMSTGRVGATLAGVAGAILLLGNANPVIELRSDSRVAIPFGPTSVQDAVIRLRRGESADVAVNQQGIDVAVALRGPDGTLIDEVDSPNGRNGDEPVSIEARAGGIYRIRIRPLSASEPQGRIELRVDALRSAAETATNRRQQSALRSAAAQWLRANDVALPGAIGSAPSIAPFDAIAGSARLIGLGEATHGSREFGDIRLALVERLVERFGFRIVALEDSTARWAALEPYVAGTAATPAIATEWNWIGRRSRKALLEWARSWNLRHPADRVRIVGIDPQFSPFWRSELPPLLQRAYGEALLKLWQSHAAELIAADEQVQVFGNSDVSGPTRDFLQDLLARVGADAPLLRPQLGDRDYERLRDRVEQLAAFADFNSGNGTLAKSRDWYMALATLRAIGPNAKGIYWAHNSHVAMNTKSWGPTGALLRSALGCGYRAVATSFGSGSFLAQVPNDPNNRLEVSVVPAAGERSVEAILAEVRPNAHVAAWSCGAKLDQPAWLAQERPMRWVGGVYAPDAPPSAAYRNYKLTEAFDAVVYVPRVKAEDAPADRPRVAPRPR